jgi:tagatose-1,6-bisphosphate aldolase
VLKVEVPVNMNFVEGFGETVCYTQAEAAAYFKEQSDATELPFIFLSAGVQITKQLPFLRSLSQMVRRHSPRLLCRIIRH